MKTELSQEQRLRRDIMGLIFILEDSDGLVITTEYVLEKLHRILEGTMIFHPSIETALNNMEQRKS